LENTIRLKNKRTYKSGGEGSKEMKERVKTTYRTPLVVWWDLHPNKSDRKTHSLGYFSRKTHSLNTEGGTQLLAPRGGGGGV